MQQTLAPNSELWNVQRRPLDLEDYISMIRRNVGWVMGPMLAGLTIASVAASFWPSTYVSTAVIRVVPPQVPERFVQTNVSTRMEERVQSMAQSILSRNTLTNLIQTYNLYAARQRRVPMEDIIEEMGNRDVKIDGFHALSDTSRNSAAFQISFAYENRYTAQKVTRDLMTKFIDENIRERSSQSKMTTEFLKEQLADAKRELDGIDQNLTKFRMSNLGRLPEQMDGNMQQVTAIESRVSALNSSQSRANQEKTILEGDLRALRGKIDSLQRSARESAAPGPMTVRQQEEDPGMARLNGEVAGLQRAVQQLLERYKPTHPDVVSAQTRLKAVQSERDSYLAQRASATPASPNAPSEPATPRLNAEERRQLSELESDIQHAQSQIKSKEQEIDRYSRDIADAERKMKEAQSRIEVGPANIQTYEELRREYNLAKERYDSLNLRVAESQMSTDVETRKQGETLEVLDLPSLPESPTAPNRPLIVGAGVGAGLMLGLVLVGFREMKDSSLKSLKDVRAYTHFAVLGNIPLLENDLIIRRRRRMAWVGWSTAMLVSVVVVGVSVYYYLSTRQ
jgi:polysaccharide chain length determinant protein (PEP-CTERM system associated)